jgi:modulator of FtsH protease
VAQDWNSFAVIAGGAAGALTGLLFVAVSLNRERIARHPALRGEAGQTLVLFLLPLLLSILLVIPGTSPQFLGAGFVVLAAAATVVLMALAALARGKQPVGDDSEARLATLLDKISPNLLTMLLILVGGCLQLAGDDGLYWIAAAAALCLIGGVVNAWLFLIR